MTYKADAVSLLRILIGDSIPPYTYCDSDLLDIFIGSVRIVLLDLSFPNDYTVNISSSTISPDPSDDSDFITLVALKAAYLIGSSEYKTQSYNAISIVDGPSTISMAASAAAFKERLNRLLDDYNKAKLQYGFGTNSGGQIVTGPITNLNSCQNYWSHQRPNQY